jgi:hypothetical protein
MTEICDALGLNPGDLPEFTTMYKSFDRLEIWMWRALLRVSAQQHPQSGHVALDGTFCDRRSASSYDRQWSGSNVQTLKVTTVPTERRSPSLTYSTTKRSLGDVVRALGWSRQFREIALMVAISNRGPLCKLLRD